MGRSGAWTAGEWIQKPNPLSRGWTLYHRHPHSSRTFVYVDRVLRNCLWRWARRRHRHRTWAWIRPRYFSRQASGRLVFRAMATDKEGRKKAVYLFHPTGQRIVPHVQIRGQANPFDPVWEEYFEQRMLRGMLQTLPGPSRLRFLWQRQQGLCQVCGQPLTPPRGCPMAEGGGPAALDDARQAAPCMRDREVGDAAAGLCGYLFKQLGDDAAAGGVLSLYDAPKPGPNKTVDWQAYCSWNVDLIRMALSGAIPISMSSSGWCFRK